MSVTQKKDQKTKTKFNQSSGIAEPKILRTAPVILVSLPDNARRELLYF
jgi:hypothetical protein